MAAHPDTDKDLSLSLRVKAMNDTLGPEGYVTSSLVFGEFPAVYTKSEAPKTRLSLESRSALAIIARKESEIYNGPDDSSACSKASNNTRNICSLSSKRQRFCMAGKAYSESNQRMVGAIQDLGNA